MQADKEKVTRMLKTARGQIDGLIKMVEDNRYCIDISNQVMAAEALLCSVNKEILHAHLAHCVKTAAGEGGAEKIDEITALVDKLLNSK